MSSAQTLLDGSTNQSTATKETANVVLLHSLCEICTKYFQRWEVLEWFGIPAEQRSRAGPDSSFLCRVVYLARYQQECHFCTLLFACIKRFPFATLEDVLEMNVHLHCREKGKETLIVDVVFVKEQPWKEEEGRHFATFGLESYRSSDLGAFTGHFSARQVPVHARDNLARAKGWIETCLAEHTVCREFQANTVAGRERPTRVLEITGEKNVTLKCDMATTQYDYVALSHMWGENHQKQIRLVKNRLQSFQSSVPWDELSSIYQEAIRVSLELGYRYIWIDSLCIIQDSPSDWEHEARRMAIVYGNAICNLAFLFPPDTSSSTRADPRIWNPCILRTATTTQPGVYIRHLTSSWTLYFPDETQPWLVQRDWPLFSRAWTFQEYLLSPRTLLYGHENLMFQCSQLFYDELLGPIEKSQSTDKGRELFKARYFPSSLFQRLDDGDDGGDGGGLPALRFVLDWMNLVEEYRTRKLSFAKDRIIALAGIATAYHKLGSLTYLAGVWWEYLPLCLLWFVNKKPAALVRGQYPEVAPRGMEPVYTTEIEEQGVADAPSWSWFSVPMYRFWRTSCLFNDDEGSIWARSVREPERSSFENVYCAQAICYQFPRHAANQYPEPDGFFDFRGLRVTLKALTWPVARDLPAELAMQIREIQSSCMYDEDLAWIPVFKYHPDVAAKSPPRNGIFALILEFQIVRTAGECNIQRRLAGLVLVPGLEEGTWIRVGVWYLKIRIKGVAVERGSMGDVVKRWRQHSLTTSWKAEDLSLV